MVLEWMNRFDEPVASADVARMHDEGAVLAVGKRLQVRNPLLSARRTDLRVRDVHEPAGIAGRSPPVAGQVEVEAAKPLPAVLVPVFAREAGRNRNRQEARLRIFRQLVTSVRIGLYAVASVRDDDAGNRPLATGYATLERRPLKRHAL